MDERRTGPAELEEQLRILTAENEMLAERAEDSLLLGLIGEKISLCDDPEALDDIALEQAAVLKNLAACVCLEREGGTATVSASFITYSARDLRGVRLSAGPDFEAALDSSSPVPVETEGGAGFSRPLTEAAGVPVRSWLLLPAGRRNGRDCVYGFADEVGNPRLEEVDSLLRRIIDIVVARRENLRLVLELRDLNGSLDRLVGERTSELNEANAALRAEMDERRRTETLLRASLEEKTVLLREVHHRVKNNLQIISSLLNLQAGELSDGSLCSTFAEIQNRVLAMSLVHEQLYLSDDMTSIDFRDFLEELVRKLGYMSTSVRVESEVDAEPIPLCLDQSIPCGLLANELITNVYKHAFAGRDRGRLFVRLRSDPDGMVMLTVQDDGIGIPEATSLETRTSIGMTLVRLLSEQLGGVARTESGDPDRPGTRITIRFPLRR